MQRMNYEVEVGKRENVEVGREFLNSKGLIQ